MGQNVEEQLIKIYNDWAKQIPDKFLTEKYSNPYYVSIPENWSESKNRIMIVGEEGAGRWGCGKVADTTSKIPYNLKVWTKDDIEEIQIYNKEQIDFQCETYRIHNQDWYDDRGFKKTGCFWKRFKKINKLDNVSVAYNNLDKIHSLSKRNRSYALFKKERDILHKDAKIKILQEEIKILEPTLVIFFGWHWNSLKLELSDIYLELCKKDWQNITIIDKETEVGKKIKFIFSYHPNARKGLEYESDLIKIVNDNLISE